MSKLDKTTNSLRITGKVRKRKITTITRPDFIVVDEAHHIVSPTYMRILDKWRDVPLLGVTATPIRLDNKPLGSVFDAMVVGPQASWLIEQGNLSGFTYYCPPEKIDLSGVRKQAGDYRADDLEQAFNTKAITGHVIEHYRKHLDGKPAIAFCINLKHCADVKAEFIAAGYRAGVIDGNMKPWDRKDIVQRLTDGRLDVLVSCSVVNEGFDVPHVQGAILLRPTQSLGMHMQQIGRALRPKPDGSKAIILDHAGNGLVHGTPDVDREWSLEAKAGKPPPNKQCKKCFRIFRGCSTRNDIRAECPEFQKRGATWHMKFKEWGIDIPPADLEEGFKVLTKHFHPDAGGTHEQMVALNNARDDAIAWLRDHDLAEIDKPEMRSSCPLLQPVERKTSLDGDFEVTVVNGELTEYKPVPWAGGLSLHATGAAFRKLMGRTHGRKDRLDEIATARGYKRGWSWHKQREFVDGKWNPPVREITNERS
jgi:hypothetical protein